MARALPVFFVFLFSTGCLCDPEYCRMPDILHPGHISVQQERMKRFNPFTRSDIGHKIDGDRPQGSDQETPVEKKLDEYQRRK